MSDRFCASLSALALSRWFRLPFRGSAQDNRLMWSTELREKDRAPCAAALPAALAVAKGGYTSTRRRCGGCTRKAAGAPPTAVDGQLDAMHEAHAAAVGK